MAERELKIKISVVRRLLKEVASYQKEEEREKVRLQDFIDQGKDEYQQKQQRKVIEQSAAMIPDSQQRLSRAVNELRDLTERYKSELSESQAYKEAEAVLVEAHV